MQRVSGHYPVPTAAVVKAENASSAAEFLNIELKLRGLPGNVTASDMELFKGTAVRILSDGNY